MSLPSTMRQVAIRKPGGPEALVAEDAPLPVPRDGEALIEVAWAGVNRPDTMQRAGLYPAPPDASPIPGLEVAGRIVAFGGGATTLRIAGSDLVLNVGDEVCALVAGGGYAQYAVAPAAWCLPIPKGMTTREASGLPETTFTVWNNVFDRAGLKTGETFLVHGGTSGIGLTAIQLAKAYGAKVIATAGSPAKVAFCREIGADEAIDYKTQDFVAETKRITGGRGADVILDMLGGDYIPRDFACLAPDGRVSLIALQRGTKAEVDLRALMMKRQTLTGSTLRASPFERKAALARSLREHVWPVIADGKYRVVVDSTFPLERAADAHARMEGGEHIGKILLEVRA